MRFWACLTICLALVSCSRPFDTRVATVPATATLHTMFVATQQPNATSGAFVYRDRLRSLKFARAAVAVPYDHEIGEIDHPNNPARGFALTRYDRLDAASFGSALDTAPGEEIFLFVHGYNSTTTEAVMRFAQMRHDFGITDTTAVFSWASAASPFAYVYDRDSVLFARDDLAQLLVQITRATDKQITLVGHSLGGQLVMETLRQLALTGDDQTLAEVGMVILISPDIDPDIFRRQAQTIGERALPYVILTSGTDRALRLSSFLIGGRLKVGQPDAVEAVTDLNVIILDLTPYADGRHGDHLVAATSPGAIDFLRQISSDDDLAQAGLIAN